MFLRDSHKLSTSSVSSGMQLSLPPSTNVGIALFYPGPTDSSYVSFDKQNHMYIQSYYDDTVNPPASTGEVVKLDRWYICLYNYTGYLYNVLSWVYGIGEPQNPTCQKVCVERVFGQ